MTNALISTIEADLKAAWGDIATTAEGVVSAAESEALTVWSDFKAIVTAALPTEYSTLKQFILTALADVTDGDLADVETAVLNLAHQTESWVENIGSATLQAIIAVVKAGVAK
ncbi:MAG TPA: hypothetical protein VHY32_02775 [Caulobacteraceae bacterium]|jgi:hypothetical protein|nr:hypothetical protein [Caulobacteraceae bacterium]